MSISRRAGVLLVLLLAVLWAVAPVHGDTPAVTPSTAATGDLGYEVLQDRPDRLVAQLPNRLILVVQELHTSPVVSTQVWVKTGSIYEQEHVGAGLSHYLEHLLSGGTTSTRTYPENKALLGRIGAQINAQTGLDEVRYYINTTREYAPIAVELLSDWMQNSLITETDFKRERDVIQREFDMGQGDPGRIFWKLTQQARYRQHPARHPTIGYLEEYLKITRPEIQAFYKRMYVPNNMVFVVVGDVDRKAIAKQVASLWSKAQPQKLPELSFPIEPQIDQPREATGTADIRQPQLRLAWPGTREAAEGDAALDLLSVVLGQGEASRLVHHVRDRGLVSNIDAYNESFSWGEGFFGIDANIRVPANPAGGVAPQAPPTVEAIRYTRAAILEEVERIRKEGVTDEELDSAKRRVMADAVFSSQSAMGLADRLGRDTISMADPDYLQHYLEKIKTVTPGQVQAAAKQFLDPSRLITLTLLPSAHGKAPPLSRPPEEQAPADLKKEPVELDNTLLVAKIRDVLKAGGTAVNPVEIGPIKLVKLPNGLRVVVQRSTAVPAVAIQFFQIGGLLSDEPGHEGVANAVQSMLLKGAGDQSAEQITHSFESLGAQVSFQCGNNSSFGQATCLKQDWSAILDLMGNVLLNPQFPAAEWDKLRPRIVDAISRQDDSWSGELRDRFRTTYFANHPWSQTAMGRADVVSKLKAEDLKAFYLSHRGASQSVLAIFGDINPDTVIKRATEVFGALPATPAVPLTLPTPMPATAQVIQFQTNKPLAAVEIGLGPGPTRQSPDYPAVRVLEEVLGAFPSGWLAEALRGRGPGLVYAVGAGSVTGIVPGCFAITFNTTPDQVPEAIQRTMEVVGRTKSGLIDEATLDHAKAAVLTGEFSNRETNSGRAMESALDLLYGLGADDSEHFMNQVKGVTPQVIQAAAEKVFRNPVVVVISSQPQPEAAVKAATQPAASQPAATEPGK